MKRTFALVFLLGALGVLCKLAFKPEDATTTRTSPSSSAPEGSAPTKTAPDIDVRALLASRYADRSEPEREMVTRVAEKFRQTAVAIDQTDGLRGLKLLDRLDLEAVYLYDKHPREFHRLREVLDDDSAADLLLHWREYFGLKRADDTDRDLLVTELSRLSPSHRRLAAKYPNALPLILAEPSGVAELVESFQGDESALEDSLTILSLISLENGASDLRAAIRTIENHRSLALEAFRQHGPAGFALVSLYGPVLEALGSAMPLDQALIVMSVNTNYLDELLRTHLPETVARHLSHVASRGLVEGVGGSPHALRLVVEFGRAGEKALVKAGPDAADVVFTDFADATLRNQAVAALGEHGPMALAMLDKYATDPDFREILRLYGPAIIPPIAQVDTSPEALAALQAKEKRTFGESLAKIALLTSGDNGQGVIRTIKKDGLDRVASLQSTEMHYYQFLPVYDMLHLSNVMRQGYSPTSGELTWAVVDACFVVTDVLSLAAIQPEGAVASEIIRTEVKAATKEGIRTAGRELAEAGAESTARATGSAAVQGAETASRRAVRWWTVRSAGGVYQVLEKLPQALSKMSLEQSLALARPLCAKAGIRLSAWGPVRFLKDGATVVMRIPPEKGLKYVGVQLLQATVGVVGFHKMEEHLASRRPRKAEPSSSQASL